MSAQTEGIEHNVMKKNFVLSMDVEDVWDLAYFPRHGIRSGSMMDGLEVFLALCEHFGIKATLFCLTDHAKNNFSVLQRAQLNGHEIALHGSDHRLPLTLSISEFKHSVDSGKKRLEDLFGVQIIGYRAPCFSIDRPRLNVLEEVGFKYDSSYIRNSSHSLYGSIDLEGFSQISQFVFKKNEFFEFGLPSADVLGKSVPISGGGYLRLLPWRLYSLLFKEFIKKSPFFGFYLHPFEFSRAKAPVIKGLSMLNSIRYRRNLGLSENRLKELIQIFYKYDWESISYSDYRSGILGEDRNSL